jgi:hypothetical protein
MKLFILCCSILSPPPGDGPDPKYQTLQFLVRSANLSDAKEAAKRAIGEACQRQGIASGEEVFLDGAFEIDELPEEGILLNWVQVSTSDDFGTITSPLPPRSNRRGVRHHYEQRENAEVAPTPLLVIGEGTLT